MIPNSPKPGKSEVAMTTKALVVVLEAISSGAMMPSKARRMLVWVSTWTRSRRARVKK